MLAQFIHTLPYDDQLRASSVWWFHNEHSITWRGFVATLRLQATEIERIYIHLCGLAHSLRLTVQAAIRMKNMMWSIEYNRIYLSIKLSTLLRCDQMIKYSRAFRCSVSRVIQVLLIFCLVLFFLPFLFFSLNIGLWHDDRYPKHSGKWHTFLKIYCCILITHRLTEQWTKNVYKYKHTHTHTFFAINVWWRDILLSAAGHAFNSNSSVTIPCFYSFLFPILLVGKK